MSCQITEPTTEVSPNVFGTEVSDAASAPGSSEDTLEIDNSTEKEDLVYQVPRDIGNETREALTHDGSERSSVSRIQENQYI